MPSLQMGSLAFGDLTNLLTALLTLIGLAFAFGSFWIANAAYQKSVSDSVEQQKNLDASRQQLQAVIDIATKQKDILDRNLETSKAQQVLLNKALQTSIIQQELLSNNFETAKAQLNLLEEQNKREREREARAPIAEIGITTSEGFKSIMEGEKLPVLRLNLEGDKKWSTMSFVVLNKGNIAISKPIIRIVASPETVFLDEPGLQLSEKHNHHVIQFNGPPSPDIDPLEVSQVPYAYSIAITVPDMVDTFDLTVSAQGQNLRRIERTIHLKVTRPSE